MKRFFMGLFLGLLASVLHAQNLPFDSSKFLNNHYRDRIKTFSGEPVKKAEILFLGNSITEFADWSILLNDHDVINRGIAGDNTYGVLARLKDVIERRPTKLFIEIGVNDIGAGFDEDSTLKNIFLIIDSVRAGSPGTKIYLMSILPVNDNVKTKFPEFLNKNQQFDFFNHKLAANADRAGYTFINLNSLLKDKDGKLNEQYAKPDGLHLNANGYQIRVKLLKEKGYL